MATAWYNYPITQEFKWKPSDTHAHSGVDIGDPYGTTVTAPMSGTIISQGFQPWGGQVNELVQTPSGPEVLSFLHLSRLADETGGGHVQAGAVIGASGTPPPGYGKGPHLHFEMTHGGTAPYMSNYNPWYPTPVSYPLNPDLFLAALRTGGGNPSDGGDPCHGDPQCHHDQVVNDQIINYPGGYFDVSEFIRNAEAPIADALKRTAVFGMTAVLAVAGLYLMFKPQVDAGLHDAVRGAEVAAL